MGFRDLRVINEDRVAPGQGFPPHNHKDMEIISLVLEGRLAHRDSMGNETILEPNQIQAMSAGSGITHSEYNPSSNDFVHFLQIWIVPDTKGIKPRYHQETSLPTVANEWVLVASKEAGIGALQIQQDVSLFAISLDEGKTKEIQLQEKRYGWIQVIDGKLQMLDQEVQSGDGISFDSSSKITLKALSASRLLFFDLK